MAQSRHMSGFVGFCRVLSPSGAALWRPKVANLARLRCFASQEQPFVTLISCYPYMIDNQRIVVTARLQPADS